MLRTVRISLASLSFLAITLLLLDVSGYLHTYLSWLAKIQFLPALMALNVGVVIALLILTLIFGRIYCSIICPLGVMQDLLARLQPRRKGKRRHYHFSPQRRWLRYGMLVLFVVALTLGLTPLVALLAPYSSYGRIVASIFRPLYELGNNALAAIAEHFDSYAFYEVDVWMRSLPTFIIAVATFLLLAILAWRGGRTYCNTICPVGTLLGFASRFSWLRIRFDEDKCRDCGACSRACKAACIDFQAHSVDGSRCVACGNCLNSCKFDALSYAPPSRQKPSTQTPEGASRRAFLIGSALAATSAALAQNKKKVDGGLAVIEDRQPPSRHTPLTPPGSLSARNMASHCTACQLCVAQCPNQVLRPSTNLSTFMQPTMDFDRGYCRPECTRCSEVCPTGAIRPIGTDQKSSIQTGHAVWVKKNCLPLADGVSCGNCARHCPTGAITMVPSDPDDDESIKIPAINEAKCIGCGACEHLCPARPFGAIYVEGHEVHKEV